jgi:putative Mg2+ transporter-C (MgtC) family protein
MYSLGYGDVLLRLGAAVLAGALIGFDREMRDKPAGLRTMALVALGSAMFVLTSVASTSPDSSSRVIQGIVAGIGFLGAGTILRGPVEQATRGLTTAASVWLSAAAGVAAGLAIWPVVLGGCGLGLLILVFAPVEERLKKTIRD